MLKSLWSIESYMSEEEVIIMRLRRIDTIELWLDKLKLLVFREAFIS